MQAQKTDADTDTDTISRHRRRHRQKYLFFRRLHGSPEGHRVCVYSPDRRRRKRAVWGERTRRTEKFAEEGDCPAPLLVCS
eukprot:1021621-Rhodomonas_salina.1